MKEICDTFISYLTKTINDSFETGNFPYELNLEEVMPTYKKKNTLNKEKYYPVSVLSDVSKIFGKFVYKQINNYIEPKFSHLLCGFRKNHNTQNSFLKMLEKWYLVLGKECNKNLNAYGFSENDIAYIKS